MGIVTTPSYFHNCIIEDVSWLPPQVSLIHTNILREIRKRGEVEMKENISDSTESPVSPVKDSEVIIVCNSSCRLICESNQLRIMSFAEEQYAPQTHIF